MKIKSKSVQLFTNEWISLNKIVDIENGIHGYVYSREESCNGEKVAILPFRKEPDTNYLYFLIRREVTPCWDPTTHFISTITGGVEKGDPFETAVNELWEEAGYDIESTDLNYLGTVFGVKSTDTVYHLFTVDLTSFDQTGEADGDGSELEKKAWCEWVDPEVVLDEMVDPMGYAIFARGSSCFF